MPTAGVTVGYNQTLLAFQKINDHNQGGINAMASINIPVTTFGERKGKVAVAKANYNIKQLELQQAADYLQLEIEQASLNYVDAYTRVELSLEALEQAAENMRISDDNYSLGMETIVNLLEAKAEWQNANSNKIDAITEFKVRESNLLKVANNLKLE
jgi:outer membrane protein TolC